MAAAPGSRSDPLQHQAGPRQWPPAAGTAVVAGGIGRAHSVAVAGFELLFHEWGNW